MSASEPAVLQKHLEGAAKRLVEAGIPGVTLGIRHNGVTVVAAAGRMHARKDAPMSAASRYPIGCFMKAFVALVFHHMEDASQLSLDAAVEDYLPELAPNGARSGVTPRHLLSHTAGYCEPSDIALRWTFTKEDFLQFFPMRSQRYAPGEVWSYAQTGHALLGEIIERASGRSVQSWVSELVFAPLGIDPALVTGASDDGEKVTLHYFVEAKKRNEPMRAPVEPGFFSNTISNWTLSVPEMLQLGGFLIDRERRGGLSARTLSLITQPIVQIPPTVGGALKERIPSAFCAGLAQYGQMFGYNGSYVGSASAIRFDPRSDFVAAVAMNVWNASARDTALSQMISRFCPSGAAAYEDVRTAELPEDLGDLAGDYHGMMFGMGAARLRSERGLIHFESALSGRDLVHASLSRDDAGAIVVRSAASWFSIGGFSAPKGGPHALLVGASAFPRQ